MRRPILVVLALGSLLLLPACRRGRGAPPAAPAAAVLAPLPASALVYYDNSGGIQDSLRLVVREAGELRELWAQATSTQSSPPPLPEVDFSEEMVLVVGAGRMSTEDLIRVDSVGVRTETAPGTERRRFLEAIVRTVEGCGGFESDAWPLAIVRVRRYEGEVRFTERRSQAEGCGTRSGSRP